MWGRGGHQDLITAVKSAKRVWVKVLLGVLFKFWGKQQNNSGEGDKKDKGARPATIGQYIQGHVGASVA